ncbi:hypothetical protein OROHE_008570 [Orobanche hederae]
MKILEDTIVPKLRTINPDTNLKQNLVSKMEFAEWLLKVRDGEIGVNNDGEVEFRLPDDILIRSIDEPVAAIFKSTYSSILDHVGDGRYFQDRDILAPTNEIVQEVNNYIVSLLPEDATEFMSSDSICPDEDDTVNREDVYYVINIDQSVELYNGTRLTVTAIGKHIIEAKTIHEKNTGVKVFIPRMIINRKGLRVLASDGKDNSTDTITNIVYKEVFAKL